MIVKTEKGLKAYTVLNANEQCGKVYNYTDNTDWKMCIFFLWGISKLGKVFMKLDTSKSDYKIHS